ncbi:DUF5916 domain-containing protein [Urechidicola vernalis]|uniref:DUF5916 domain-containing protein n=1 Tax=Urechidicola vernalis TaxID=3075600 RepID=A0ABU2Y0J7_9FLAO|nr:DUF5916 domain-containing protein [Urechidicola sp. P050]MDT0551689.1 DUF5916 domain-containing protein [Urechidicola sp. P050]
MKNIPLLCILLLTSVLYSQNAKKSTNAQRVKNAPKIDGKLDDAAWLNVEPAKDFMMFEPSSGIPEPENRKTTVKIVYDDKAIYIGAYLFDDAPSEIPMQFGNRDEIGQVDYLQVNFNPNNDGQNDTEFIVMSTGVQADSKSSNSGNSRRKDMSWSTVWYSDVSVVDDGWIVEMKIPYAALRFSNDEVQTWGLNILRNFKKQNESYSWNFIDRTKGNYPQYAGEIKGIENIKPPTRIEFYPYAAGAVNFYDGETSSISSIGMDLKYGLDETFTLDATLIPDFGQTAFDNQELNLGPFEQRFEERRTFFTEGTELFNKGSLFYSRRIGNRPTKYSEAEDDLEENEEVIENPSTVKMLNAVKVSGRTKKGLGIGFFNAITERTYARITDTITNESRKFMTESLTNYNVMVLDQQFNRNSSVSLINTNTFREGDFRDANVTGLTFDLADKNNLYKVRGNFKLSNVNEFDELTTGMSTFLNFDKNSGNVQYGVGAWMVDEKYDISDLGFLRENNTQRYWADLSYEIFEPTNAFNSYRFSINPGIKYQHNPHEFSSADIEFESFFVTIDRFAFGADFTTLLGDEYDFREARSSDPSVYFRQNGGFQAGVMVSSDYRKKFAYDIRPNFAKRYDDHFEEYEVSISPRYRFTDKFNMIYELNLGKTLNEKGRVTELDDETIIFGNRDKKTIENVLTSNLSFNRKSTMALAFRHYWSTVRYDEQFYSLNNSGLLDPHPYDENSDINYNVWNLDLSYVWEFAPGSQLIGLYRNSIFDYNDQSYLDFGENLDELFSQEIGHNISLKLIYYIDYNNAKTWFKKKA